MLVTLHDGVAVPKVIDFGVAKATGPQPLTDHTLFTQFAQMVGQAGSSRGQARLAESRLAQVRVSEGTSLVLGGRVAAARRSFREGRASSPA